MNKILCILISCFVLACASIPEPSEELKTLLIGEVVFTNNGYNPWSPGINFDKVITHGVEITFTENTTHKNYGVYSKGPTGIFGVSVPPGNYYISKIYYKKDSVGGGWSELSSNPSAHTKFTVVPGAVNNLGHLEWKYISTDGSYFNSTKNFEGVRTDFVSDKPKSLWKNYQWENIQISTGFSIVQNLNGKMNLTKMGWVIENIDTSFWLDTGKKSHAFLNFFLYFNTYIDVEKIESVRVNGPKNSSWTIPYKIYVDNQKKYIGGYIRLPAQDNNDKIYLGEYKAEVKLSTGELLTASQVIHTVGTEENNGADSLVSEDIAQKENESGNLLKRAENMSFIRNSEFHGFKVSFNVKDARVFNGSIWFYDADKQLVGTAQSFINEQDGKARDIINKGSDLYNDGTLNEVVLNSQNIEYKQGCSFNSVYSCVVVLTDGFQYEKKVMYNSFDYRSISKHAVFVER